jgi:glycosyltransferase involved in cell wall biosynthesis
MSKKISVIMPALNEEESLAGAVANVMEGFEQFSIDGELVIVNDGSSDHTRNIAEGLSSRFDSVRVLNHETPLGIGSAFRDGLHEANGELVIYIPGDGEINAAEIFRYIPLMADVDLVVPYVKNPEIRSWCRRFLSSCYHLIMTGTFCVSLRYLNGTVIYRKVILEGIAIKNAGFFYQAELLIKTLRRGYLYVEVPYVQKQRINGTSKSVTLKALSAVLKGYFSLIGELYFQRSEHPDVAQFSITAQKQLSAVPLVTGKHP